MTRVITDARAGLGDAARETPALRLALFASPPRPSCWHGYRSGRPGYGLAAKSIRSGRRGKPRRPDRFEAHEETAMNERELRALVEADLLKKK